MTADIKVIAPAGGKPKFTSLRHLALWSKMSSSAPRYETKNYYSEFF